MKSLVACFLLFAIPGFAAAPAANGDLTDAACPYPAAALAAKAEGRTLLSFAGSPRGSLDGMTVIGASGNADLDRAAARCAAQWRFDPASVMGKRLIGPGRLAIAWKLAPEPAGKRAAIPHACQQDYPPAAAAAQASGTTRVRFVITAEGRVKDPAVETSSGNADLDAAAMTCVGFWRYRPALKNGQPVEVPWKADIKWELYEAPVPEE